MILDWFNVKEASLTGIKLADDLTAELRKIKLKKSKKKPTNDNKTLQKVFSQIKQKDNLNFYKKSKLINEFKWRLLETDIDKEFVEFAARELTFYLNQ